jgi:nucleotide-binding universal stress UspA family protein
MAGMGTHVLVPMDGSDQATAAFEHALEQFPDARITLVHVINPLEAGYSAGPSALGRAEEWYEQERENADVLFEEARETAAAAGHDGEIETATELGRPARTVVEYADEHDVDQVVVGSHGRSGVTRILLGSVAESVIRRAPCPVTVVR